MKSCLVWYEITSLLATETIKASFSITDYKSIPVGKWKISGTSMFTKDPLTPITVKMKGSKSNNGCFYAESTSIM